MPAHQAPATRPAPRGLEWKAKVAAAKAKSAAARDDAKNKAAAKRAADRTARQQQKQFMDQVQMFHSAVYNALTGVGIEMQATPGNYAHSRWAVADPVCDHCGYPPKGCMCI